MNRDKLVFVGVLIPRTHLIRLQNILCVVAGILTQIYDIGLIVKQLVLDVVYGERGHSRGELLHREKGRILKGFFIRFVHVYKLHILIKLNLCLAHVFLLLNKEFHHPCIIFNIEIDQAVSSRIFVPHAWHTRPVHYF